MNRLIYSLLAGFLLAGAANAADLDEIKERGTLNVAVASLSPFVIRSETGQLTGFEIDSMLALGEHLGVNVQFIERPFCKLVDTVVNGEADMIASGFSNTPDRRRILDFSLPYHDTEYFAVVAKSTVRKAKTMRALNSKDVTIGYQEGGVSGQVAHGDFSGATLKGFSSFTDIVEALKAGEIDGAVMFSPYQEMVTKLKERKYVVPHEFALTRTIESYAVDKGAEDLRDALNEWVIARDLDGYWDDLEKKWFNPESAVISTPPPFSCPSQVPVQ